jgi:hypothetical protein
VEILAGNDRAEGDGEQRDRDHHLAVGDYLVTFRLETLIQKWGVSPISAHTRNFLRKNKGMIEQTDITRDIPILILTEDQQ